MHLRERFEDYRGRIRFTDLDLASRSMALLWLGLFRDRVIRNCFPRIGAQSLLSDITKIINSTFLEGYILARAAYDLGTGSVLFTDPERQASVEAGVDRLRLMYEEEEVGTIPFTGEPLGVEALADALVREIAYGPDMMWLEERELLKVHLIYALWAGYKLARFERRLSRERG
ncbi:MAG: hypothetical protein C4536_16115 [Actinobacteria bacterium]|nr:MAG: hypothetical protein C4536_16115 [Actinomycetota bacterium]